MAVEYRLIKIEDFADPENSILRQVQPQVEFPLSEEDRELMDYLKVKCLESEGVGLAASQMNAARHMVVIYIPEAAVTLREQARPYPVHVIINGSYEPVIEDGMSEDFEACYSVGSIMGKVKRYNSIKLKYRDEEGNLIESLEHGFYARVLQHEIDHCNGILFTDRLDGNSVQGPYLEMLKIRRQELPPEKRGVFNEIMSRKGIVLENESS